MKPESTERLIKLRNGYTTGACATATSLAAATLLLTDKRLKTITITLPRGECVNFALTACHHKDGERSYASTTKDGGDDPDATHGATVFAEVCLSSQPGVRLHAAEGVGTVTRAGLALAVGEPAINPVPRKMIKDHLSALATEHNYQGGFEVYVGIHGGEEIALKTMNGRLGILGGLSILGTTGIVRPYSCASYIASIHQGMEVAHANGHKHIAAATGSTSERYTEQVLAMPDIAIVEMGDFASAVFKHLRKVPMEKLSICGGFGKISKMAAGHTALHSQHSAIDFNFLASHARDLGATEEIAKAIIKANTSLEALQLCQQQQLPLGDTVSALARETALTATGNAVEIDVYCLNKTGQLVGSCLS